MRKGRLQNIGLQGTRSRDSGFQSPRFHAGGSGFQDLVE